MVENARLTAQNAELTAQNAELTAQNTELATQRAHLFYATQHNEFLREQLEESQAQSARFLGYLMEGDSKTDAVIESQKKKIRVLKAKLLKAKAKLMLRKTK